MSNVGVDVLRGDGLSGRDGGRRGTEFLVFCRSDSRLGAAEGEGFLGAFCGGAGGGARAACGWHFVRCFRRAMESSGICGDFGDVLNMGWGRVELGC